MYTRMHDAHVYMYNYIRIYLYRQVSRRGHIYIYIHIARERERERLLTAAAGSRTSCGGTMESERPKGPQGEGRCRRASRTGQGGNGNKQKAREQGAVKMCRTFITHDIHASSSSCIDTVRVPSAWEQLAWVAKTGARIISVGLG